MRISRRVFGIPRDTRVRRFANQADAESAFRDVLMTWDRHLPRILERQVANNFSDGDHSLPNLGREVMVRGRTELQFRTGGVR